AGRLVAQSGAGRHPGGKQLQSLRRVFRRGPGPDAGHALLAGENRPSQRQPLRRSHQSAHGVHHTGVLPETLRRRYGRSPATLQRQLREHGIFRPGTQGAANQMVRAMNHTNPTIGSETRQGDPMLLSRYARILTLGAHVGLILVLAWWAVWTNAPPGQ